MSVILIGNGTSVLDSSNGPKVDLFQTIGRFNRYEIKGYEKHVGTKTSIWFCGMPMKAQDWRMQRKYDQIILHSWQSNEGKCDITRGFREALPTATMEKVDHAVLSEMSEYIHTNYRYWSTGAIAIWIMTRKFPLVHLTGFDWWERKDQHYFLPSAFRGSLHKPEEEKLFIEKLQSEGKVQFL
jgi:hypothetical protein